MVFAVGWTREEAVMTMMSFRRGMQDGHDRHHLRDDHHCNHRATYTSNVGAYTHESVCWLKARILSRVDRNRQSIR